MKNPTVSADLFATLQAGDYHFDALGRMVIDNPNLLDAIGGAIADNENALPSPFWNGACSNQHC